MLSKAGSNSELGRGLSHILEDLEKNLPNSLDELQDPVAYLKYVLPPKKNHVIPRLGNCFLFGYLLSLAQACRTWIST